MIFKLQVYKYYCTDFQLRDIAMNVYYTERTSTGGLNTFFGALKGGARHYFIIEEGGANKNLSNPDARYRIG